METDDNFRSVETDTISEWRSIKPVNRMKSFFALAPQDQDLEDEEQCDNIFDETISDN